MCLFWKILKCRRCVSGQPGTGAAEVVVSVLDSGTQGRAAQRTGWAYGWGSWGLHLGLASRHKFTLELFRSVTSVSLGLRYLGSQGCPAFGLHAGGVEGWRGHSFDMALNKAMIQMISR